MDKTPVGRNVCTDISKVAEQCLTQGLDVCKRALIDSTEIISVKLKLLAAAQFSRWAILSTLAKSLLSIFL
ncbi:hypothetical protein [Microcoleus sp. herbarium2]|uniref:hypothetical protein n=1 Tax=Microcoleus sp. herbarium2 TaxID=3055433 RepID=UPI002FD30CA4